MNCGFVKGNSKRAQIARAFLENPTADYLVIAEQVRCNISYVMQVKSDLRLRHGFDIPRGLYGHKETHEPVERVRTVVGDWFIDTDGCRTRLVQGVAA